jgi:hypothetical protein
MASLKINFIIIFFVLHDKSSEATYLQHFAQIPLRVLCISMNSEITLKYNTQNFQIVHTCNKKSLKSVKYITNDISWTNFNLYTNKCLKTTDTLKKTKKHHRAMSSVYWRSVAEM